jgi:hypothetical protein
VVVVAPTDAVVEEMLRDGGRRPLELVETRGACASFQGVGSFASGLVVRACASVESRGADARWGVERFVIDGLEPDSSVGVWLALADARGEARTIEVNGAPFEVSRAMLAEGAAWVELSRDGTTEIAVRIDSPGP